MRSSVFASILSIGGASAPPTSEHAATARWMVENFNWGYLTSISSRSTDSQIGDPFGNPYAFADVAGVPYFYATDLDATLVDVGAGNTRLSLGLSEAEFIGTDDEVSACIISKYGDPYADPENPPCARLALSGVYRKVVEGSAEDVAARAALFDKHPSFPNEPHDFYALTIDVDSVWLLDDYGGEAIASITPADYYAASAARVLRQAQKKQQHVQVALSRDRPPPAEQVSTARWMVESATWGALGTISTGGEGRVAGDPFSNPYSFAGGPNGELYLFTSDKDVSMTDIKSNNRASFSLSEAALTNTALSVKACVIGESKFGDPENPPCGRLVFSGSVSKLAKSSSEYATAKAALYAAHPSFRNYPQGASNDCYVAQFDIEGIWFIDHYGGADNMVVADYFSWNADTVTIKAFETPSASPVPLATPAGLINVGGSENEGFVSFTYSLTALEKTVKCDTTPKNGAGDVPNGCGIHIHRGTNCDTTDNGGHYYDTSTISADPWATIRYITHDNLGTASGEVSVVIGETALVDHAFVVHDSAGTRVGCGLITADALTRAMHLKTVVV